MKIETSIAVRKAKLVTLLNDLGYPPDKSPSEATLIRAMVIIQNTEEIFLDAATTLGAKNEVKMLRIAEDVEQRVWDMLQRVLIEAKRVAA